MHSFHAGDRNIYIYIDSSMTMRVGQGSAFANVRWTNRADAVETTGQTSRVESLNSLGSGELCCATLRRLFYKMTHADINMDREIA